MDIYTALSFMLESGADIHLVKQDDDMFCEVQVQPGPVNHILIGRGLSEAVNGSAEWLAGHDPDAAAASAWAASAAAVSGPLREIMVDAITAGRMTTAQLRSLARWNASDVRDAALAQLTALGAR